MPRKPIPCDSSTWSYLQFGKLSCISDYPITFFVGMLSYFWYLYKPSLRLSMCSQTYRESSGNVIRHIHSHILCRVVPCHAVPSVADLFPAWFSWLNSYECVSFEGRPDVTSVPYTFELHWNILHTWDILLDRSRKLSFFFETTNILGSYNRVNKTSGIAVQLKTTSEVTNLITQILAFLAYTLN
jgi:hypothetical protein